MVKRGEMVRHIKFITCIGVVCIGVFSVVSSVDAADFAPSSSNGGGSVMPATSGGGGSFPSFSSPGSQSFPSYSSGGGSPFGRSGGYPTSSSGGGLGNTFSSPLSSSNPTSSGMGSGLGNNGFRQPLSSNVSPYSRGDMYSDYNKLTNLGNGSNNARSNNLGPGFNVPVTGSSSELNPARNNILSKFGDKTPGLVQDFANMPKDQQMKTLEYANRDIWNWQDQKNQVDAAGQPICSIQ